MIVAVSVHIEKALLMVVERGFFFCYLFTIHLEISGTIHKLQWIAEI